MKPRTVRADSFRRSPYGPAKGFVYGSAREPTESDRCLARAGPRRVAS